MALSDVLPEWTNKTAFAVELLRDDCGRAMVCLVDGSGLDQIVEDDEFDRLRSELLTWPRSEHSRQPFVLVSDMRVLRDLGIDIVDYTIGIDVSLLWNGVPATSIKECLGPLAEEVDVREQMWKAQLRACRAANIDLSSRSALYELVPRRITRAHMRARGQATIQLWREAGRQNKGNILYNTKRLMSTASRLYTIEQNGIRVDHERARSLVSAGAGSVAQLASLRSMAASDGWVWTRFDPVGGKTGRYKVKSGFNCMSLPKGSPRECVVSRHDRGLITVVDFNAIDYRCIVDSIDDPEFRVKYEGCDDFHARTTSFLFGVSGVNPLRRDVIKKMTYVYLYGGSEQTLASGTGLSLHKVREVLDRLDRHLGPIAVFRERLASFGRVAGSIKIPDGSFVSVAPDDHDGKILGLYAQTYSSRVFDRAFVAAVDSLRGLRSKVLFTVHDELVVDEHPDEREAVDAMVRAMETAAGPSFTLKVKRGRTYEDVG